MDKWECVVLEVWFFIDSRHCKTTRIKNSKTEKKGVRKIILTNGN